jgi:hypothetical protein
MISARVPPYSNFSFSAAVRWAVGTTSVTDPHGQPPRGVAGSVAKAAYYLGGFTLGYLWQVRRRLVRSTLIVSDRYAHDFEVDPKRFRYGGPQSIAKFVRLMAPRARPRHPTRRTAQRVVGSQTGVAPRRVRSDSTNDTAPSASLPNGARHRRDVARPRGCCARGRRRFSALWQSGSTGACCSAAVNMPRHIALNSEAP